MLMLKKMMDLLKRKQDKMIQVKNMYCNYLITSLIQKDSPHKVKLEYDYQYPIKGVDKPPTKLDFGNPMKMKEVIYVPD